MEQKTPKQKYDEEMGNIKQANAEANGQTEESEINDMADEAEKVMDEMESREQKAIDKSMGDVKEPASGSFTPPKQHQKTITREEFLKMKEAQAAQKSLKILQQQQAAGTHLSSKEHNTLVSILKRHEKGELKDPVLVAFLDEKIDLSRKYVEATVAVKELQKKLLNEISECTNNMVKCRGAIEQVDRMLLKQHRKIKQEPTPIKEKVN